MELYKDNSVRAYTIGEKYPFGTKTWYFENDACGRDEVLLSMNACSNEEFNCEDTA